jgi:hypothetical protein
MIPNAERDIYPASVLFEDAPKVRKPEPALPGSAEEE